MRTIRNLAAVSVLALALSACGGPAEEDEAVVDEAEDVAEAADITDGEEVAAADGEDEAAEEVEETAEEPEAEETPAPAATPTPTPTQAAAPVGPPASFTQCQICHAVEPGQNGIGPSLAGVFGRGAGSVTGFSYTEGMRSSGLTWNQATLDRYLADPSGVVPGTTMAVGPLDAAQRRAIIEYLKTL